MNTLNIADGLKFTSPAAYQILIKGFLDESWSERLNGLTIVNMNSETGVPITKIYGQVRDQAELLGVLNSIYEMHLPLISIDFGLDASESPETGN
ncbi:MAG: hypothetical protein AB1Z51_08410 [Desulfuromonadales bacterium]